jgi:very-short-patch-repair endonuclease
MSHRTPRLRTFARSMRHAPSPAEALIWRWLRSRRFDGYKFRRQEPIGAYIADFFCAELNLVIEVDGRHHSSAPVQDSDAIRTEKLQRRGITVVRITNADLRLGRAVEEQIRWAIERAESALSVDGCTKRG